MLKFITGNPNKFLEVQSQLAPTAIRRVEIDLDEIQELDPKKIIRHKLGQALKLQRGEFIVEDISLFLECFGNQLPGPLIKWFNMALGNKRIYEIAKLTGKNKATLTAIVGYAKSPKDISYFEGSVQGTIVSPQGGGGFGFDPIFLPNGSGKTLAELKKSGDFKFSARARAIKKLKRHLQN